MSDQLYSQALNLIDTLAQKQHLKGLADFEYVLYQKLCDAMGVYFGGLKYAFQISAMKTEMECSKEEAGYLTWIMEQEKAKIDAEKAEAEAEKKKQEPPEEQPPTDEV